MREEEGICSSLMWLRSSCSSTHKIYIAGKDQFSGTRVADGVPFCRWQIACYIHSLHRSLTCLRVWAAKTPRCSQHAHSLNEFELQSVHVWMPLCQLRMYVVKLRYARCMQIEETAVVEEEEARCGLRAARSLQWFCGEDRCHGNMEQKNILTSIHLCTLALDIEQAVVE